ncbi:family 43 glycosylhydrolase [Luteipulveratus mongoliensis]|uniref:Glycoside hydrolase n=1 Tax=Luteipulveratus mongoliensis TaxID=571913 RepID=A0A0K1JLY5_9MICO|nr:family 43 glycosylhydrolase [Luteipulveratus mongoliensis]AKU17719.1 glycoside hydrolase [Luteipulveratus mongoliensis]
MRTALRLGFVLALVAATAVPMQRADAAGTEAPHLVIAQNFPDPDVSRFGNTYYAYATNQGLTVPYATASSVNGPWTIKGDALPVLGTWADAGWTWAPDVSQRADGSYLMYYTARSRATGRQCIGTATAATPAGPFQPAPEPLVCNASEGGDIDPSSFVDGDQRYLLYKNDGNAVEAPPSIWLQPVAQDGVTLTGDRVELLRNDQSAEGGVIEAPVLVKRPSQYVLFYSANGFGGDEYFTSYAVSTSLTGPYVKAGRPLMTTASVDGAVHGPGGQDIVGDDAIVFHGWVDGGRGMYAASLGWANDYPVVRGSRVLYEAEDSTLNHCVVRADDAASGGKVAAQIDYDDSWVERKVFAPVAGAYTAHIGYAAGYGDAQHTLTINGGAATVVGYVDHGWENWQEVAVDISLQAGWNTVRLQHLSRWAEIDYIQIS